MELHIHVHTVSLSTVHTPTLATQPSVQLDLESGTVCRRT